MGVIEVSLVGTDRVALVDDADYGLVSHCRWYLQPHGPRRAYAARSWRSGEFQLMHNLIMGAVGIDHVNHNGLDNRRENLRLASRSLNGANQPVRSGRGSSQYKGVTKFRGKWMAQIRVGGVKQHLGVFTDEREAAAAYDRAAVEVFGEFACLNGVEE